MIWFAADYHLGHKLLAALRGFAPGWGKEWFDHRDINPDDVHQMNQAIVRRHNEFVQPGDDFYFLGDLGLADPRGLIKYVRQMNGNWHVIRGNHNGVMEAIHKIEPFCWVKDRYVLQTQIGDDKMQIVLDHYPLESWQNRQHGAVHLHGHCHGKLERNDPRRLDVGIDAGNDRPLNIVDVYQRLVMAPLEKVDGHNPGDAR